MDSKGAVTAYEYDPEHRLLSETYADGGSIHYRYDLKGRLIQRLDQKGESVDFSYDEVDLLREKRYGAHGQQEFDYDANSRLIRHTDNNGGSELVSVEQSFDALGRELSSSQRIGDGAARVVEREFDRLGRVSSLRYPSGLQVDLQYTALNQLDRVLRVADNVTTTVAEMDYQYETPHDGDLRPLLQNKRLGASSNTVARYVHDALGRTLDLSWWRSEELIHGSHHSYDLVGNRIQDRHWHGGPVETERYSYDAVNRLVDYGVNDASAQSWQLDDLGNWETFTEAGHTQNRSHNAVNEIQSVDDQSIVHDLKGNMSYHKGKTYVWDVLNRLISVYKTDGQTGCVAQYLYDAMNRRVMKRIDTDEDGACDRDLVFTYDGQRSIESIDALSGNLHQRHIFGGSFVDEILCTDNGDAGDLSYTVHDLRYSVYAVVDGSGTVLERYQYTPYGERTVMTAEFVELPESAIGQEFGYTGRRHDAEDTGLMYFRARYYSGELGRFVGRDPLGYVDGMSMYRGYFVVNGVDPSGMATTYPFSCSNPNCHHNNASTMNLPEFVSFVVTYLGGAKVLPSWVPGPPYSTLGETGSEYPNGDNPNIPPWQPENPSDDWPGPQPPDPNNPDSDDPWQPENPNDDWPGPQPPDPNDPDPSGICFDGSIPQECPCDQTWSCGAQACI